MKSFVAVAVLGVLTGVGLRAQEPERMPKGAHPVFEVATIRPANPDDQSAGFHLEGHRIFIENERVTDLLMFAYGLHAKQIVDGPAWMSERFDIHGTPDIAAAPDFTQLQEMVQKLLAERFGLKFHEDQREMPIYTLTVAKGGPKLERSKGDPDAINDETGSVNSKSEFWKYTNESMDKFAKAMQNSQDRPVVDKTGLAGKYDFTLKWKTDVAADEADLVDLFTAVQEQLGLKLSADKGMAKVLVIERLERPSEN
jgi:uncharacterized protein (TIGR03435 family)